MSIIAKYLNDQSLHGKLHNIYFYALMFLSKLEVDSPIYELIDNLKDTSYRAVALIIVHPNQSDSIVHRQNLEGYLSDVAKAISQIPQEFQDYTEVKEMKKYYAEASKMAFGESAAIV